MDLLKWFKATEKPEEVNNYETMTDEELESLNVKLGKQRCSIKVEQQAIQLILGERLKKKDITVNVPEPMKVKVGGK